MKDVRVARIPDCDVCSATGDGPRPGEYDTPLTGEAQALFGASWAGLCREHFDQYGIDTSVTVRRVNA